MVVARRHLLGGAAAMLPSRFAIAQSATARTLRLIPQANLTLLDPHFTTAQVTTNHGYAVFDTLLGLNNRLEVCPQMAAGYSFEDDGRTFVVPLRDGLKFHDGEPVLARDCVASMQRWAAREALGQSAARFIAEWGTKDDKTVRLRLHRPVPMLPSLLARGATVAFVMPERLAKTDPFKQVQEMVGSGPYKFVRDEFVPGSRVVYAKNTDYVPRQEPAEWTSGGKVVHFDRYEWVVIPDAATAANALMTGEADWYEQVQPDLVAALRRNPAVAIGSANPTGFNGILRFNHIQPPFDNVAIRRAVMMAVDQNDFMASVTANDTTAWRICKSLLPCGTPDGREIGASAMPGDIDKARAALTQAGYKGEKVVILSPSDFVTIGPMGDVLFDLLRRLGMNVEIVQTDWGTVSQRRNNRQSVDKGGWSALCTWGTTTAIGNPISQFFIRGVGDTGWAGWYKDDTVEDLTDRWLLATTDAERAAAADALQHRVFDRVPSVPLGQFHVRTAYRRDLSGLIEASGALPWNVRRVR